MTRHYKSLHEKQKSYGPCPHCDAMFARTDALARHLRVEDERIKKAARNGGVDEGSIRSQESELPY
jgi:hypothetical protein